MTRLVLLRHGDTNWSFERRIQGRTDIPLSEDGARKLSGRLLPDDCKRLRVFSSPLKRCVQTAEALGLNDISLDERLIEMRWGSWEGRRLPELRAELGREMEENEERGLDFRPPGGESPRDVQVRVTSWLSEIAPVGEPTLAIAHRGVIRVILAAAFGWDFRGRPPQKLDWDCLHCFELDAAGMPGMPRLNIPLPRKASSGTVT